MKLAAIILVAALTPPAPPVPRVPEVQPPMPTATLSVLMGPGFTVTCCTASGMAYDNRGGFYVRHGDRWELAP